jgi:ubiquinone/menaquinone biosynthesis C-methylase UbiE
MFAYYGRRAHEYDDIYQGGGPASIDDPEAYRAEVGALSSIVSRCCRGDILDVACGTAFWTPHYAGGCRRITLFDQSAEMLAEARARAAAAGVAQRTLALRGDVLQYHFGQQRYDTILAAFLVSHFTLAQEARFFSVLRSVAKPRGALLILDTVWNEARARRRKKEGSQERTLADGSSFRIYKRYFTKGDIEALSRTRGISLKIEHFGKVFLAASGRFATDGSLGEPTAGPSAGEPER